MIILEGDARMQEVLRNLGADAGPVVARELYEEGTAILTRSQEQYVPVDTGILRASGYVEPPVTDGPVTTVAIGYGGAASAYAVSVHENPRAGHTEGRSPQGRPYKHWARVGEWKYLETPWKAAVEGWLGRLGQALERAWAARGVT